MGTATPSSDDLLGISDTLAGTPLIEEARLFDFIPEFSDLGNAKRFAQLLSGQVYWCPSQNNWYEWDRKRYKPIPKESLLRIATSVVLRCRAIAELIADKKVRQETLQYIHRCESLASIRNMIGLAKAFLAIDLEEFDRDRMLFNAANGTLDLRTGAISKHDPGNLISKLCPYEIADTPDCPTFLRFIDEITCWREELSAFLQVCAGIWLSGDTTVQKFSLIYGTGNNGKSVYLNSIRRCLGEYAIVMTSNSLLLRKHSEIPNDVAALRGYRLVICSEAEKGERLAEARVKLLTGGDEVAARFLYGEYFAYRPQCKIVFCTNHLPRIQGSDHAIWRRIVLIPFDHVVRPEDVNPKLEEQLMAEAPGILRWMAEGFLRYQKEGLVTPQVVRDAVAGYRESEDRLGEFLTDMTDHDSAALIRSSDLYRGYVEWAKNSGTEMLSQRTFSEAMSERGMRKRTTKTGKYWVGLHYRGKG